MANDETEKKTGMIRKTFNFLSSPWCTIPFGAFMMMVASPVVADVGTWYRHAHDEGNLMIEALQMALEPITGQIPIQLGLTMEEVPLSSFWRWALQKELAFLENRNAERERAGQQEIDTEALDEEEAANQNDQLLSTFGLAP